jgi:hypothetical protein
MARNTEKGAKCETNTIRHGIWRETVKNYKYEKQFRTWIVARKTKNWKMRHKHSMRWNMARNTEKRKK